MGTRPGHPPTIRVQVFDILSVIQASGQLTHLETSCRFVRLDLPRTSQDVCCYYDVKLAACEIRDARQSGCRDAARLILERAKLLKGLRGEPAGF